MKVLMLGRPRILSNPGGDTTLMEKTKAALERLGWHAGITEESEPMLEGFDVVHCFGIMDPVESMAHEVHRARRAGYPVVISPVFWPSPEAAIHSYRGATAVRRRAVTRVAKEAVKRTPAYPLALMAWGAAHGRPWADLRHAARCALPRCLRSSDSLRRRMLECCQVVLPNSHTELGVLTAMFPALPPALISYCGVDSLYLDASPQWFIDRFRRDDFILCVGTVYPRKNQLALIEALGGDGSRLVFVGRNDGSYGELCRRKAPRALFIPRLEGSDLASAYAAASVHALPSWYETPGLASLEALVAGCPVVTTPLGSVGEYFGSASEYCAPDDLAGLREAVARAAGERPARETREAFAQRFSWQNAAAVTAAAYEKALETSA
jgi:glycosyltransferase involved in cell wall biosynthesis